MKEKEKEKFLLDYHTGLAIVQDTLDYVPANPDRNPKATKHVRRSTTFDHADLLKEYGECERPKLVHRYVCARCPRYFICDKDKREQSAAIEKAVEILERSHEAVSLAENLVLSVVYKLSKEQTR